MDRLVETCGERLGVTSERRWVLDLVDEACPGGAAGDPRPPSVPAEPSVVVSIEADRSPFPVDRCRVLTRGAWCRDGEVVVRDACTSGFDLRLTVDEGVPVFTLRWRPPRRTHLANAAMRSRFVLLARSILVQYPALWAAGVRGRAPLHAAALTVADVAVVLAGPGGVGKTTLLAGELAAGSTATADNLVVSDGRSVWGLAEPLRIEGASGRRMAHGRREATFPARVPSLRPAVGVVVRRGAGTAATVEPSGADDLHRQLVAGTYMAGELRRFWALASTLALGTGAGPAHPPVADVAAALAANVDTFDLTLGARPGPRLLTLLQPHLSVSSIELESQACTSMS